MQLAWYVEGMCGDATCSLRGVDSHVAFLLTSLTDDEALGAAVFA